MREPAECRDFKMAPAVATPEQIERMIMKPILKIATLAAAAFALTAGTAFAGEGQRTMLHNGRGQTITLFGAPGRQTTTIGFFSRGRGLGERMTWNGREWTRPVVMHDGRGREFVVFEAAR
ncbi:MAG TPA: hypothetical protein VEO95_08270 [Chthoniobacteraceae bacterium]|nr:hypothetical protein [Chthoniobacteraceae bacterium]